MEIVRPSGVSKQPTDTFTGTVFRESVLPKTDDVIVNTVTFTPGARTHWHVHERGQLLWVTSGKGYVQKRGEEPRPIHAGDTVWIPPDEDHWHGAASDCPMTHVAVSLGKTDWGEPVEEDA
ncbi:MAG TPA: cupin domain-containing protein [Solirubrobacterales bacterium]